MMTSKVYISTEDLPVGDMLLSSAEEMDLIITGLPIWRAKKSETVYAETEPEGSCARV